MGNQSQKLREMMSKEGTVVCPGVYDALGAKMVEKAGFPAVYTGGFAIAASHGYPDVGLVTMTEMLTRNRDVIRSCSLPVVADIDTGYGGVINVMRTIREFEDLGVAAVHMEDQTFPKKCGSMQHRSVISREEMCEKIRAAVEARRDSSFIIIARTDAISVEGLNPAIDRAVAYVEAGADAILPQMSPGFKLDEMRTFNRSIDVPGVMLLSETEVWVRNHPMWSVDQMAEVGFRLCILPLFVLCSVAMAISRALDHMKEKRSSASYLSEMMDFPTITSLLGLAEVYRTEKKHGR